MSSQDLRSAVAPIGSSVDRIQVTRGIACLLLVMFHVVGGNADDGLRISDSSAIRKALDTLLYIRMPLFAFISGYVYALKPLDPAHPLPFLRGKFRRLALPLISATTIFYLVALMRTPVPAEQVAAGLAHAYFFSYEIYWFLQAMMLIFLILPLLETVLGTWPGCAAAVLVSFLLTIPAEPLDFLSINGALFLAPFFLIGIAARRFIGPLSPIRSAALLVILAIAMAMHVHNVLVLPPHMGARRGTILSLLIGGITPLLLVAHAPRIALLARIGHASFVIFLFHIFFIVAIRMLLLELGITNIVVQLAAGLAAAIVGPMMLQSVLTRWRMTRIVFLGQR